MDKSERRQGTKIKEDKELELKEDNGLKTREDKGLSRIYSEGSEIIAWKRSSCEKMKCDDWNL